MDVGFAEEQGHLSVPLEGSGAKHARQNRIQSRAITIKVMFMDSRNGAVDAGTYSPEARTITHGRLPRSLQASSGRRLHG